MAGTNRSAAAAAGRELPNSIEAEEYLLSSCMFDGVDVVARCILARVSPDDFYDTKHGIIYEKILSLYHRNLSTDVALVAEELKTSRQLDQVGGYAFMTQVSSRIPTTAQASYFIGKVKELATLRALIRAHTAAVEDCYNYSGGMPDLIDSIRGRTDKAAIGDDVAAAMRSIMSFELPPEDDPSSLLGRNRYISRGDGALLVSSSGMGKSVMNYEWAIHAALGRPFLGIETKTKLTSLIIQSEDSDGDIGEVVFSLCLALKLSAEEIAEVNKRVVIVTDKVNRGEAFIARLRVLVDRVKPDLVWLNPLHAFAGCDIADARELGNFLRAGLNGVNKDSRFAYMIVHHTPKPMTGKGVADKKWHEFMYDAAGSAELVNWARAVLTLKPTDRDGEFNLILAKRGKRAGVMIPVQSESGSEYLELTTKVPLRHSSATVSVEGRKHPFHVLHWETRSADAAEQQESKPAKKSAGREPRGKAFEEEYTNADLIRYFPAQKDEPSTYSATLRFAAEGCGISKSTLTRRMKELIEAGLIAQLADGRWSRTERGDYFAKDVLSQTK